MIVLPLPALELILTQREARRGRYRESGDRSVYIRRHASRVCRIVVRTASNRKSVYTVLDDRNRYLICRSVEKRPIERGGIGRVREVLIVGIHREWIVSQVLSAGIARYAGGGKPKALSKAWPQRVSFTAGITLSVVVNV